MNAAGPIGVLGGGAWGTALAQVLAEGGSDVLLWARNGAVVEAVNTRRQNETYLPGQPLSPRIRATQAPDDLASAGALLVVTPSQSMRAVLSQFAPQGQSLILCSKGIEAGSHLLMHEVAREVMPGSPVAVLSGPTFAHEVAAGLPTAVTLAAEEEALARLLADVIARPTFRPYVSDDVVGAEIGGAVKNVLAIACGVVEGAGLGQNARAALIARGFAEMTRFGLARGGRPETMAGLSGLGDLVLTCSSTRSRNYALGYGLGQGQSPDALLAHRHTVAEGASTAPVLHEAARAQGIDMPVTEAVCALLSGASRVDDVIAALLARPLRAE
ncbi:glycerol-3-phosphate dehydrogenase (NAD(P)+) [Sphingobium sp. B1D7B]|uniref:NAD(P)H-dependent glycerol-3-phosphate dehydrogenase n=1 Tax=unclassified Sphingobium TaxID=2611147 RepID=UPI0022251CAC|nr:MULTISPECIES: NAD(P)H-dependent glycerol-3-phosphate dehydrogenase [unclassified Sphingobium]MCW2392893.1 glycerol-3-phosphate dehydrogenase (NAD(P)+) [Sphingobium sp. B11D3A]MCW2404695.1 glycerol-3-phosphate dehydrogenase (NAD(P)+) [Sphingobium sp. B1D7B]